jgi:hypothetical protein
MMMFLRAGFNLSFRVCFMQRRGVSRKDVKFHAKLAREQGRNAWFMQRREVSRKVRKGAMFVSRKVGKKRKDAKFHAKLAREQCLFHAKLAKEQLYFVSRKARKGAKTQVFYFSKEL